MIRTDREINFNKILSFGYNDIIVILNIGSCTMSDTGVESCRPKYLHVYHLPKCLSENLNVQLIMEALLVNILIITNWLDNIK